MSPHASTPPSRSFAFDRALDFSLELLRDRVHPFLHLRPSVSSLRPIVAVIEADATDRRTLCTLLKSLNVDVHDYDSAESYLASNGEKLGCVITDVSLPGMSGLDLLRLLRSARISPPVILLGEEADVKAAVAAMRAGAVDFIEKPHMDGAIVRRVAYLLDHAQMELRH